MKDTIIQSFGPAELIAEAKAERIERLDEFDTVLCRTLDTTLAQAQTGIRRRDYESPEVHKALTILSIPPDIARLHLFPFHKGLELKHLLLQMDPDYKNRLFARGIRCIGAEPLSESLAFCSPVLNERFHQSGAHEVLHVIRRGYADFRDRYPDLDTHAEWMKDTGISVDTRPFERIHLSDPTYAQEYPRNTRYLYGSLHPREIFGPNPGSRFFWDRTLADLSPEIIEQGSLFTRDTVMSLYERREQCDMLAAWRFDPNILYQDRTPYSPETYRHLLGNFRTYMLGQVAEDGIVFLTHGCGSSTADEIYRTVFAQCLTRILQISGTRHVAYPYVNPFRKNLWTDKSVYDYRSMPPELIESFPDILDLLSLSAFIFEINEPVLETVDRFLLDDDELQGAITRGKEVNRETVSDLRKIETLKKAHTTPDISRRLRATIIGEIADSLGQRKGGNRHPSGANRRKRRR
jgi:hypothetical protein